MDLSTTIAPLVTSVTGRSVFSCRTFIDIETSISKGLLKIDIFEQGLNFRVVMYHSKVWTHQAAYRRSDRMLSHDLAT